MKKVIVKFSKEHHLNKHFNRTWELEKTGDEEIHITNWYNFMTGTPFSEKRYGSGFFISIEGAEALLQALQKILK